jgi:cell shape-determining protein MreC
MANAKESSKREDDINFILKVKAKRKKNGPLEFTLDLNPESRLISIKETFSSYEELSSILNTINEELKKTNDRTRDYERVLQINESAKKELGFNPGYDQNFKPQFGKIDKIVFKRNSPGESNVSYVRSYNGDKQPH